MYSFTIKSVVEKLRLREELPALAERLKNDLKLTEAFRMASFDVSCLVIEGCRDLEDPDLKEALIQKMLTGRIEGIKKTPLALVKDYIALMVDRCSLGLHEGCVNQVSELRKLDEIVTALSSNEHVMLDAQLGFRFGVLLFEVVNRPTCEFGQSLAVAQLVSSLIGKLLAALQEPSDIAEFLATRASHPFNASRKQLRLCCTWFVIATSDYFESSVCFKESAEQLLRLVGGLPKLASFQDFVLEKDLAGVRAGLKATDARRWLFLLTKVQDFLWEILSDALRKTGDSLEAGTAAGLPLLERFLRAEMREHFAQVTAEHKM